jgi:hypothetical protein
LTKRDLRQKRRELTIDPDLSANFLTEELNKALLAVKSGKAAGFDGVYLEDGSDPSHFRLICNIFKILERMIPLIDPVVPVSQAAFRKNRSCTEQVLALTSYIEASFQRITAAYDTVWRDGLMLKFMRFVPCANLSNLLNNMVF